MSIKGKEKQIISARGSIAIITTFLLCSAMLRVMTGAGTAIAEGELVERLTQSGVSEDTGERNEIQRMEHVEKILKALQEREKRVEQREQYLKTHAKALEVAKIEVERRITALELAEERLSATLALADTAAEEDIILLTTVYENMKPKDAIPLFSAMEPKFAAGFLGRMRPEIAAEILSGLEPQSAYSISAILAGRNASVPTN